MGSDCTVVTRPRRSSNGPREPRLRDERQHADHHVEEREEGEELRSLAVGVRSVRAQEPVEERLDDRAGKHEEREVTEIRELADDLPAAARDGFHRRFGAVSAARHPQRGAETDGVDAREKHQHRRHRQVSRRAPRDDASEDAADRAATRDPPDELLGLVWIEPLVDQ